MPLAAQQDTINAHVSSTSGLLQPSRRFGSRSNSYTGCQNTNFSVHSQHWMVHRCENGLGIVGQLGRQSQLAANDALIHHVQVLVVERGLCTTQNMQESVSRFGANKDVQCYDSC